MARRRKQKPLRTPPTATSLALSTPIAMAVSSNALLRSSPFPLLHITRLRRLLARPQSLAFRSNTQLRRASSRSLKFDQEGVGRGDDPASGGRIWSRTINSVYGVDRGYDDEEEDMEEEEEDRSLVLLVRFVQNVFRKISKRTRRAVRSVLPPSIPTELVGFSVNGVLVLAFLWVLKAFLEVVCTLGSIVFVSILMIRGILTGVTYLQDARHHNLNEINDDPRAWNNAQPAT